MRLRRLGAVITVLLTGSLVLALPAWAASVSAVEYRFSPPALTISVGQSVTWTNAGKVPHTTTSDGNLWDSGALNPGQSFTFTFRSAGTFSYHCQFHRALGMVGVIVVRSASGGSSSRGLPNTGSNLEPLLWFGSGLVVLGGALLLAAWRRPWVRRSMR